MSRTMSPRRRLALYATVAALARSGSSGLFPAVLLVAIAAGDGVQRGSIVLATITAVGAISGPFVGGLLGRERHPKRGFVVSIAVAAAAALLLGIGLPQWPLAPLLITAALLGLAFPALTGGWSGQARRIAPEIAPSRTYAVDVGTYNMADVIGPALVGLAAIADAAIPGAVTLETVSVLYLLGLLLLLALPVPERTDLEGPRESLRVALGRLGVVRTSPVLLRSMIVGTVTIVATGTALVAMPLLAEALTGDASIGAPLLSVVAVGALTGSVVMARLRVGTAHLERLMYLGLVAVAACFTLLASAPNLAVVIAGLVLLGLAQSPMLTAIFTLRDRESTEASRSIVFVTAASLRTAGVSLGTLIGAALASGVGALPGWRAMLAASAGVTLLAGVLAAAVPRRASG